MNSGILGILQSLREDGIDGTCGFEVFRIIHLYDEQQAGDITVLQTPDQFSDVLNASFSGCIREFHYSVVLKSDTFDFDEISPAAAFGHHIYA